MVPFDSRDLITNPAKGSAMFPSFLKCFSEPFYLSLTISKTAYRTSVIMILLYDRVFQSLGHGYPQNFNHSYI